MKVGIFVYFIPIGKSGGVQRYSEQLISALGKYSNIEVVVFCAPQNKEIFLPYAADKVSIIVLPKRCKYLRVLTNNRYLRQSPFFSALTKKIFYNRYSARIMDWLGDYKHMIEKKVDVIHFPYQVLDRYDFSIPTLITLHDLQQKYFPEFFTKDEIKERDTYFKKSAELCTRVIVSFEHVKKDIVNFYGISPKKIDVCSLGYDIGPSMDTAKFPEILKKYNIPEEMQSCHTSFVNGYFVEGHVPIEAINKLIEESPEIDGIALPGMPSGSLGMPGIKEGRLKIYSITNGTASIFMEI